MNIEARGELLFHQNVTQHEEINLTFLRDIIEHFEIFNIYFEEIGSLELGLEEIDPLSDDYYRVISQIPYESANKFMINTNGQSVLNKLNHLFEKLNAIDTVSIQRYDGLKLEFSYLEDNDSKNYLANVRMLIEAAYDIDKDVLYTSHQEHRIELLEKTAENLNDIYGEVAGTYSEFGTNRLYDILKDGFENEYNDFGDVETFVEESKDMVFIENYAKIQQQVYIENINRQDFHQIIQTLNKTDILYKRSDSEAFLEEHAAAIYSLMQEMREKD